MPGRAASRPLCPERLTDLVQLHNHQSLVWGVAGLLGSLILWALSYLIVLGFVWLFCIAVLTFYPSALLVHGVTLGSMALLLVEGVRYTGELYDFNRYWDSFYSWGANWVTVSPAGIHRGGPLQMAFGLSQLFLSAPRASVTGYRKLRGRLAVDPAAIAHACDLFDHLAAAGMDWTEAHTLGDHAHHLKYLDATNLLWTRIDDPTNHLQVRLSAEARSRYLGM